MKIEVRSTLVSLVLNGQIRHMLTPWHIIVDADNETITVTKRNWYLVGNDEETISFRFIRKITIDEHVFGADINIKVVGGNVSAFFISKNDAKRIKNLLLSYNTKKKNQSIIS